MQQEPNEAGDVFVEPSLSQPLQQDDNMLNPQERRLVLKPQQVMSPNQAIPIMPQEVDTFNVPNLPFSQAQRNEFFSETSSRIYRELCGPEGVVLQQNNILQQVIQEVRHDPNIHGTISEQQENIGQIINEIYRLRDELAKMKLTLKQGFILIDETCAKHASVLEGLQSFAGAEIGANQRIHETLQRLSNQMGTLQQKTLELERNTSLDWRMQSIEDDINTLQNRSQGGSSVIGQDRIISQLSQQVQALSQNPLWHEMQKTAVEVQQFKEVINPVMKDIEFRLKKLKTVVEDQSGEENVQKMKQKLHPVMQDIERRLIALENRPVETAISNVSFAEENPSTMTTLIERVQVLELKVNNLEPSLATLHSSISSTPLEPPEDHRRKEGSINDPSFSQENSLERRIESLESWIKTSSASASSPTVKYNMGELEGRLLKRIQTLESQLTQIGVQELPNRQRELETKMNRLMQVDDLPSFGASTSSKTPNSLELRLNKLEVSNESLITENKKLQARLNALEESRTPTTVRQIMDRLDNVIRVVNDHDTENYQVGQSINDIQQELSTLRQTVDSWNAEEEEVEEGQQDDLPQNEVPDLPVQEDQGRSPEPPPGLPRSASIAGSATTVIVSVLELPLFKGSKRVFVRDAHLFVIGKYVIIDRWFVSQIVGRGSIFIDDPAPADFQAGTSVRTIGPEDEWTVDDDGRMYLNGIPTNMHSGQRMVNSRDTEVFQTPPTTPRQHLVEEEDDGLIYLNRILPLDHTHQDSTDLLACGKPKPPHDFDQETLVEESPLQQWLLDGSSRRSHQHWKQIYQYYRRHEPTPSELNGRDMVLKQHNVLEV